MNTYFTADTHFGHNNIIEHSYRPFKSIEEMDEAIINRINLVAKPEDELYHLGDFAWSESWKTYRSRIHCKRIHLIAGNHDSSKECNKASKQGLFESVSKYIDLKKDGFKLILCHYPIESWRPGYVHLHGHTHGNSKTMPGRLDVGVDAQMFSPVSFGLIREALQPQEFEERH